MRATPRALALAASILFLGAVTPGCRQPADLAAHGAAPATRRYRDVTKHSPRSVRASLHRLDWSNKPTLYRSYPGAETVPLPAPRRLTRPALESLAAARPAPETEAPTLDLELLGTVLFLSNGITGKRPSTGGDIRATAAAGALYPNDLYVVAGELPGLAAGVYHYEPKWRRLSRLRRGDWRGPLARAADDHGVRRAPATVVLSGILWRSAWKYGERAYRHLHWDGGMILAHLLASAQAAGLPATVIGAFVDAEVDRLLGFDGREEVALALVRLGGHSSPAPYLSAIPPLTVRPGALSHHPVEHPEALRYHAASSLREARAVRALRAAAIRRRRTEPPAATTRVLPPPTASPADATLDAVVRRRRSTRHFVHRPITAAELAAVLEVATRGAPADFLSRQRTLIETYLIVNAVDGIDPGAYYYDRRSHRLTPLKAGSFRKVAGFLCLEQALARDAAAVLYYLADLDAIGGAFGERGYRLAELEAGLAAGRAYLAAYALGRGASGLTFYDDEVTSFFSPHAAGLEPLLVVAVGVPAKRR